MKYGLTNEYYSCVLSDLLYSGSINTSTEGMFEDITTEETDRFYSIFRADLSLKRLLPDVAKEIPLLALIVLTCPIWLLYDELITPIHGWIIQIRYQHEHMPVYQKHKLTKEEKTILLIQCAICLVLVAILICLAYLMSKQ